MSGREYPRCPRCGRAVVGAMMRSEAITGKDGELYYHPNVVSVYCESGDCNYDKLLRDLPTPSREGFGVQVEHGTSVMRALVKELTPTAHADLEPGMVNELRLAAIHLLAATVNVQVEDGEEKFSPQISAWCCDCGKHLEISKVRCGDCTDHVPLDVRILDQHGDRLAALEARLDEHERSPHPEVRRVNRKVRRDS